MACNIIYYLVAVGIHLQPLNTPTSILYQLCTTQSHVPSSQSTVSSAGTGRGTQYRRRRRAGVTVKRGRRGPRPRAALPLPEQRKRGDTLKGERKRGGKGGREDAAASTSARWHRLAGCAAAQEARPRGRFVNVLCSDGARAQTSARERASRAEPSAGDNGGERVRRLLG